MRLNRLVIACVVVGLVTASAGHPDALLPLWEAAYSDLPVPPAPISAGDAEPALLVPGAELVRTPREYLDITVLLHAQEAATATLQVEDIFTDSVLASEPLTLAADQSAGLRIDLRAKGRPMSMLSDVHLDVAEGSVKVEAIRIGFLTELRPQPDVTVTGPETGASLQEALNKLPQTGGIVYIPAGEYVFAEQVTVPCGNVSIYGDGAATILQGTWHEAKGLIGAEGLSNLRFTRLHLRSLPITEFRGYSEARYARVPEDAGRPSVMARGIELHNCSNARVDHCEIELFGHAGVIFYGGHDNLVDHCFLHENFRYGYGYGVATPGTQGLHIEDNNFENHRHGIAGNAGGATYIARYNRLVKDASAFASWQQSPDGIKQLRAHEIDAHAKTGMIIAHNNYVQMIGAVMGGGAVMRGNPGRIYENVFVSCSPGVRCIGASDDVWTWDNICHDCPSETASEATGAIHFGERPASFEPIPYPHKLNRLGWWPGLNTQPLVTSDPTGCFAGPRPEVSRGAGKQ